MLDGTPIDGMPPQKRQMAMVFQTYALFPHLTVAQNIGYGLKLQRRSRDEIDTAMKIALTSMNLVGLENRSPHELSGGQQQRVALARALVMQPKVLLFDEPLSNLDAKLRDAMRAEIRRIQRMLGITSLYVTHDQDEAMSMSDRIVVMNKGRVEQVATPAEIYLRPASGLRRRLHRPRQLHRGPPPPRRPWYGRGDRLWPADDRRGHRHPDRPRLGGLPYGPTRNPYRPSRTGQRDGRRTLRHLPRGVGRLRSRNQ